jgi:DNA-binding transcriptional ArsR family regulator
MYETRETLKMPRYEDAIARKNSRKVIRALAECGGVANFSEIRKRSCVKDSVLAYHLNLLQSLNVVEKEVKGTYRLKYKTPLCYVFEGTAETPIAYLGLLGRRETRSEPETSTALELLRKADVKPRLVYVATSPEALNDWKELKLPYQWILCYEEEIINVDAVKNKVTPQLESLLRDYIVIVDCTSATKPATIAYYELAQTYCAPLIYVYEETKQLKWLISKETIKRKFGIS